MKSIKIAYNLVFSLLAFLKNCGSVLLPQPFMVFDSVLLLWATKSHENRYFSEMIPGVIFSVGALVTLPMAVTVIFPPETVRSTDA